jgi:hypothetical protein
MIQALRTVACRPPRSSLKSTAYRSGVFVAIARSRASFAGRTKQVLAQKRRIRRRQSECSREDASLMPPAWVSRIEAVVAKFGDVHDRAVAAWQLHIANYSQLWAVPAYL